MAPAQPYVMSPVEIARGFPIGYLPGAGLAGEHLGPVCGPRAALEAAVLPALTRSPCVVAFSGGRDSSAVLAVATHVARAEGLALPVPVTKVFPGIPESDETQWQELVVAYLGLEDWVRIPVADELDLVGAVAGPRLRRFGVCWSALLHTDAPVVAAAHGGVILDGEGGDEVLGPGRHRMSLLRRLLRSPPRPSRVAAGDLFEALGPRRARRVLHRLARRRVWAMRLTWLQPQAAEDLVSELAALEAVAPLRWDRSVERQLGERAQQLAMLNRRYFAASSEVEYSYPLLDPRFVAALAQRGGAWGFRDRTAAMGMLVGDLLPEAVLGRESKTRFNEAVTRGATRSFLADWQGEGVDPELVDIEELRRQWRRTVDDGRTLHMATAAMLQAAWLAVQGGPAPAAVEGTDDHPALPR